MMAATRKAQTIVLAAANDEITGRVMVQGVALDHTTTATATITDSAGNTMIALRCSATKLRDFQVFPKGLLMDGVKCSAITATSVLHVFVSTEC